MRNIFIATTLLLLASCQQPVALKRTELDVSGPLYRFNVANIKVVEDFRSPHRPPNAEYLADITPAAAVKQWVTARVIQAGQSGMLEIDIKDASVIKKDIPKKKTGIEGFFTKEQTEEYDGTLEVTLKIYSERKILSVANVDVIAHQTLTLREDATVLDRQALYHQMTVNLIGALNSELDRNIHTYFTNYLL